MRTLKLTADEETDRTRMQAEGLIDCVVDLLPPSASITAVRAAMMAVRPYGRVVLMGGVGMLGGPGLELAYPWIMRSCISIHGSWLAAPSANARIVALVRAGLLDLAGYASTELPLAAANDAVAHAAANGGPFRMTVLTP